MNINKFIKLCKEKAPPGATFEETKDNFSFIWKDVCKLIVRWKQNYVTIELLKNKIKPDDLTAISKFATKIEKTLDKYQKQEAGR